MPPNVLKTELLYSSSSSLNENALPTDLEGVWFCPASEKSLRTINPIRAIVDPIVSTSIKSGAERGDGKDQISLALGDPTVFGNLPPCPAAIEAITETLKMGGAMATGYVNACGTPEARAAIAERHGASATADNVIVASGCSGALELALTALLDADSILLVPSPGFPLYSVIAKSHGAKVEHYDLLPDSGWECDLVQMDQLITRLNNIDGHNRSMQENTCGSRPPTKVVRGIVVNNPGNPTGSVYSAHHLRNILKLAHKHRIPIVADEIYGDLVFDPNRCFFPMAEISAQMGRYVPVITASGLGKQYLVPGWRVGWVIFHDNHHGSLKEVEAGAKRLAQVTLGASHLIQCAIPAVLQPKDIVGMLEWKKGLTNTLKHQALFLCDRLTESCHGLTAFWPQGAMYAMVKIDVSKFDRNVIYDDMSFMKHLLEEENVFVLPGRAFGMIPSLKQPCYVFRVVYCAPQEILEQAVKRIANFCQLHAITK